MTFVQRLDGDCQPLPEPAPAPEPEITQDWFPAINPVDLRTRNRIREAVTADRWREALIAGIITVNRDLTGWQTTQRSSGYDSLSAVPALMIAGSSHLIFLYERAVALNAKAEIIERYRDIDMSGTGEKRADDLDQTPDELRRDAIHAVRDILGVTRTTVDLI